jgi:hypothetical protein
VPWRAQKHVTVLCYKAGALCIALGYLLLRQEAPLTVVLLADASMCNAGVCGLARKEQCIYWEHH